MPRLRLSSVCSLSASPNSFNHSFLLSIRPNRILNRIHFQFGVITPQVIPIGNIRQFSMMSVAHSRNNDSTEQEDGQVKIHSRPQQQQQQHPKTQAELEKEIWQEAHRLACEGNRKKYIDPKTGYTVMTELLHRRRGYCCGNACRHCPYNNENVGVSPKVKKANIERGKQRRKEIEAVEGKPVWADEDDMEDSYSD